MKTWMHTLVLLALPLLLSAQAQFNGRITDAATGEGIINANVVLLVDSQLIKGTSTDLEGYFNMALITPGFYQIRVSYIGYHTVTVAATKFSEGQIRNMDFALQLDEGKMLTGGEVVYYEGLIDLGFAADVDVITSTEIEDLPLDPADVPALSAKTYQSDAGEPIQFRGSRVGGTLYMMDGMRVIGAPYLIRNSIDEMQIYSGGVPAKYGDFTGGVIVIETKSYKLKSY